MSHIYKVFEHIKRLRIGIWPHTHTVTTTDNKMAEMSHAFFILDREINVCAPSCVIGMFWWLAMFVGDCSKQVEIIEVTWGATVTN